MRVDIINTELNMGFKSKLVVFLAVALLFSGCIGGRGSKQVEKPRVYVTPCNVAGKGVQIRVSAEELSTTAVKPELEGIFVDDFTSPAAEGMRKSMEVDCYWGNNVGERRDYYYCKGKYQAPELDENRVIKRFLWKDFKIGFSIEEHNVGSWIDSSGRTHKEGSVYYLTVRTVDAQCYVA